jgi:cytosine/uracil/thiamine/allantoin permease
MASRSLISRSLIAATVVLTLAATHARAAVLISDPDCSASANSFNCHLAGVLSFLYVAAALLAVVLVLVIVLAVRSYRRRSDDKRLP